MQLFAFAYLCLLSFSAAAPSSDKCSNAIPIPTEDGVNEFMERNPITRDNDAYESNGLIQGDMFGLDTKYDTEKKEIIMPEGFDSDKLRWPNKMIPYAFYERISRKSVQVVLDAMKDLEEKTCIRFVPVSSEEDYLKISPGKSCASPVGYKQGEGEHVVSVNPSCMDDLGALQHEIMHALGIFHEQSRPDRDNYVFVDFKNVQSDATSQTQFFRLRDSSMVDLGIPYDYTSVMHYPAISFAKDKTRPTVFPNEKGKKEIIGQRVQLSPLDIKRINRLYRCDDNPLDEAKNQISQKAKEGHEKTFKQWDQLCDMSYDTSDGWDEQPDVCMQMCRRLDNKTLGPDGFNLFNAASTRQCLWKAELCNGMRDSSLGLDEEPAFCQKYCRLGGYVSLPRTFQCIHFSKLCDGNVDVQNGTDEDTEVCKQMVQSPSSGLLGELFNSEDEGMRVQKKTWLCDGKHTGPMADPKYCTAHCKDDGFLPIGASKQCIHFRKLRDGHVDTTSGDDENATIAQAACNQASQSLQGEVMFLPNTMQCVSRKWLCDGQQRDKDDVMQDPAFCKQHCTGSGFILAEDSGQCFNMLKLCDGKRDSRSGWDEVRENCEKACKPTADFPPAGQSLQQDPATGRCKLISAQAGSSQMADVQNPANPAPADRSRHARSLDKEPIVSPSLPFIIGRSKKVAKSDGIFELIIANNTHEFLECSNKQVITTISADFLPLRHCPNLSWSDKVARKCDQLPTCGFIARDPSTQPGCMARKLVVLYSCAAAIEPFRTDPSADDLCNKDSNKPVDANVQCNLSAETLIP